MTIIMRQQEKVERIMKCSELDDSEDPNLIKNLEDELYEIRKEERE